MRELPEIGRDGPARRVGCRAASGAATQLRVHPPLRLVEGVAEAVIGGRARPADRQAHRDRPGFEPQLADLADALDEVDGLDLVGLGQQDAEAARPEPGDVVGPAGMPADRIGDGRQDPVGRVHAEDRRHAIEPIELDEHDRGRSPVAPDAGPLVGEDQVPFARQEHAGQRVRAAGDRGPFGRVDRRRVGPGRGRRAQDIAGRDGRAAMNRASWRRRRHARTTASVMRITLAATRTVSRSAMLSVISSVS